MPHLRDLLGDRRSEDGEGQRHAAGRVFGDPVHHRAALGLGQFGNLGREAERGHAVDAAGQAGLHL
ncbi:hypothetical protein D9M72_648340 [compost metagenome]